MSLCVSLQSSPQGQAGATAGERRAVPSLPGRHAGRALPRAELARSRPQAWGHARPCLPGGPGGVGTGWAWAASARQWGLRFPQTKEGVDCGALTQGRPSSGRHGAGDWGSQRGRFWAHGGKGWWFCVFLGAAPFHRHAVISSGLAGTVRKCVAHPQSLPQQTEESRARLTQEGRGPGLRAGAGPLGKKGGTAGGWPRWCWWAREGRGAGGC